jgi:diguanylate cyclase (GGDEF)-like protein
MRDGDIIGRLGGEEFVVLLRLENVAELPVIADRLRQVVEMSNETGIAQTMSVGTAIMDAHETFDQALHRADQAMYRAKQTGRNRTVQG